MTAAHVFHPSRDELAATLGASLCVVAIAHAATLELWPAAAPRMAMAAWLCAGLVVWMAWRRYRASSLVIDESRGVIEQRGVDPFTVDFRQVERIRVREDHDRECTSIAVESASGTFDISPAFVGRKAQADAIARLVDRLFANP